jgi:hypothetical protein
MSVAEYLEEDAWGRRLFLLCALLLVAVPVVQVGVQLWPLQLRNLQWRFGAANALSNVLLLPFLGLALVTLLARMTASTGLARTVGAITALATLLLAASLGLFVLDAGELKAIVRDQAMPAFKSSTVRVGVVTAVFTMAYAVLAVVSFVRMPGSSRPTPRRSDSRREDPSPLIVGQG